MATELPLIKTLDQIDAVIDGAADPGALIVTHWEWFVVRDAGRDLKTRNTGGLIYRGLNVWISGETRIADRAEAEWLDECPPQAMLGRGWGSESG